MWYGVAADTNIGKIPRFELTRSITYKQNVVRIQTMAPSNHGKVDTELKSNFHQLNHLHSAAVKRYCCYNKKKKTICKDFCVQFIVTGITSRVSGLLLVLLQHLIWGEKSFWQEDEHTVFLHSSCWRSFPEILLIR